MAISIRNQIIKILEERIKECEEELRRDIERTGKGSNVVHILRNNLELNKRLLAKSKSENCVGVDYINYGID